MSRAFVKETENDTTGLPDRPISPDRHFVTEAGLAEIEAALNRSFPESWCAARRWRAATGMPPPRRREKSATGARGARARKSSKPQMTKARHPSVTLRRDDGREQSFRIVGEDEADPSRGTLSHLSPLARALLPQGPGKAVAIAGHEAIILDVR